MLTPDVLDAYWSIPPDKLLSMLGSGDGGLGSREAQARLARYGPNDVEASRSPHLLRRAVARFSDPLLLLLVFAAGISALLRNWVDALVVILIIAMSVVIGAIQEHRASHAVAALRNRMTARSNVLRDGQVLTVPSKTLVPGDVVLLSAGNLIPADGIVLDAKDLYINQSLLSGETFPVEKRPGIAAPGAGLPERGNCVFMGTSVSSGTGKALVLQTASATEFGAIAGKLARREPETEFEKGVRRFGALLMRVMFLIVMTVLIVNVLLQRATADTLLFAIALAVGLSPELLPAILTVTLAQGSQKMARLGVIVKRLNAIENLGGMTVLCTDKTGTLTQGVVRLDAAVGVDGRPSAEVARWACLNARLQTGLANPLDQAILADGKAAEDELNAYRKLDEIPYDFQRRRLSIVVHGPDAGQPVLIMKGALDYVLDVCDRYWQEGAARPLDAQAREAIGRRFASWSGQGFRVLGVAHREIGPKDRYTREDEESLVFSGFLLFFDPPEPQVTKTLQDLRRLGVELKIITGDNHAVARHVAQAVGLDVRHPLTGTDLASMNEEALWHLAPQSSLFAEVDPHQKERIVRALQKTGHVVGFLGDGINDAPALHAADVGISVDRAVDVAREAADIVLLEHDLNLLRKGIDEGRHTFANTLKYVFITTSANFGNMISMAAAALFLPFLPLLAKQILLNNFLSDIPALGLAGDNVDREWDRTPHRWDIHLIRSFMIAFGLISTLFDFITFGALFYLVSESPALFRTGWFVESLLTELFVLLVIRTYRPFYQSPPGRLLGVSVLLIAAFTIALPYLPFAGVFDFVPLPFPVMACMLAITLFYVLLSEASKRRFYRRFGFGA